MNVAFVKTNPVHVVDDAFAAARARLPGGSEVADKRQRAYETFKRLGLPHRRIEDWKYTDLRATMREIMPIAAPPDEAALARAASLLKHRAIADARKLVLVDGVIAPGLSDLQALESGLTIRALHDALNDGDPGFVERVFAGEPADAMIALNRALASDGFVVDIADNVTLTRPLHIIHIVSGATPAAMFTRSLVAVGKHARATLVESFIATDQAEIYQAFDAATIELGDDAAVEHIRLIEDARNAFNIANASITLGVRAHYNAFGLVSGAHVSRYQAVIVFAGEGAHAATNGVNLLNGRQHGDTTLVLDHAVANCASREIFRAVLDDRGHSVFQGRIIVRPHAQKTDAKMMTRALLLSDDAEADNKPELEIFADDVTCGHGATTGALDESLLFYLRTRGLSEKQAQTLLIQAFVGEAIETIADDRLRELAMATAERWLEARA